MAERKRGGGGGGGGAPNAARRIAQLEKENGELRERIKALHEALPISVGMPLDWETDVSSAGATGKLSIGEGDGQKIRKLTGPTEAYADLAARMVKLSNAEPAPEPFPAPEPAP